MTAEREATRIPRNKTRWDQVGRVDAMTLAAAGLQQAAQQEVVRQAQTQVEQHQLAVNAKFADVKPMEAPAKPLSSDIERAAIDAEAEEEAARLPKRPDVDLFKAIFSDDSEDEEAEVATGDGKAHALSSSSQLPASTPAVTKTSPSNESGSVTQAPPPPGSTSGTVAESKLPPPSETVARQSLPSSDFVSSTSHDLRPQARRPVQPLELQHHHPLASTTAVSVVNQGSKVQIKLTHLQDDDDDWEEVATSTVGGIWLLVMMAG